MKIVSHTVEIGCIDDKSQSCFILHLDEETQIDILTKLWFSDDSREVGVETIKARKIYVFFKDCNVFKGFEYQLGWDDEDSHIDYIDSSSIASKVVECELDNLVENYILSNLINFN